MSEGNIDDASQCSADELMRINPLMAGCAGILIEACKKSEEGRIALAQWDKYRGICASALRAQRAPT